MITRKQVDIWANLRYSLFDLNAVDPRSNAPSINSYFSYDKQKWIEYSKK
jgi:hypothetical protein